jgi:hypothetical protein
MANVKSWISGEIRISFTITERMTESDLLKYIQTLRKDKMVKLAMKNQSKHVSSPVKVDIFVSGPEE